MAELDDLRDRVAVLERENLALRDPIQVERRGWLRPTLAAILIVAGVLTAPVAAIGAWARVELVDTDRFVATFAPLAQDPAVQAFIVDEVTAAIEAQIDVEGMVGEVVDGIRGLGLPPKTDAALQLLTGPAAMGIESVIASVVTDVVSSHTFADVWAQTLRVTHTGAIAVIQGNPDAVLTLGQDGVLSVRLDVVIDAVRTELLDRGVGFASAIPTISREMPVLQSDALPQVRAGYNLAVAAGYWLPWVALVLTTAGILVARRRLPALTGAAAGLGLMFALLAGALGIGKSVFVGAVSPSLVPAAAADVMFVQLTTYLLAAAVSLAVLGGLVAAGSWWAGSSRPARSMRAVVEGGCAGLRAAGDRHGVSTGHFGEFVDRWHSALVVLIVLLGALLIFIGGVPSVGAVVGVVVGAVVLILLAELVRRPGERD